MKQALVMLFLCNLVSQLPAETWTLITEDSEIAPERYSVGGSLESPVVETDYMSGIFGEMKITTVDFLDEENAIVTFANRAHRATYKAADFSHYLFILPNSGMIVLLVSPENDCTRAFAYSLEQDFAPFTGIKEIPVGENEQNMLQKLGLDAMQIQAIRQHGTRYIRYRGIVQISEP